MVRETPPACQISFAGRFCQASQKSPKIIVRRMVAGHTRFNSEDIAPVKAVRTYITSCSSLKHKKHTHAGERTSGSYRQHEDKKRQVPPGDESSYWYVKKQQAANFSCANHRYGPRAHTPDTRINQLLVGHQQQSTGTIPRDGQQGRGSQQEGGTLE
ncbi:unnamed protein product [Ectocarpus sp. 12 AP-2014]